MHLGALGIWRSIMVGIQLKSGTYLRIDELRRKLGEVGAIAVVSKISGIYSHDKTLMICISYRVAKTVKSQKGHAMQ